MAIHSVRVLWQQVSGRTTLDYAWPGVIKGISVVHISASEATNWQPQPNGSVQVNRFVGSAPIIVESVSPKPDHVQFVVKVDWKTPVDIVTDITVLDPPEAFAVGSLSGGVG